MQSSIFGSALSASCVSLRMKILCDGDDEEEEDGWLDGSLKQVKSPFSKFYPIRSIFVSISRKNRFSKKEPIRFFF